MAKNIVFIGLMGSGKTTLGKYTAKKTGMLFFDTDELIVKKAQKPIKAIFADEGELYFRELETEVIKDISQKTDCVISTGGGAVLKQENIEYLKKTGVLFYLEASPEELYRRTKNDFSRPLLKGDNPIKILEKLLISRKSFYDKADFKINTENKTLEEAFKQAHALYSQFSP
ncbi:MAG TPA: shikimate kinase [Candidatus Gastranaerophilales bacterium]|nr:shikimate kinase [Candidatus Gastranaerophilales bacterium]